MDYEIRTAIGSEDGQTMAEYALVVAVLALAVIATLGTLGGAVSDLVGQVAGLFS